MNAVAQVQTPRLTPVDQLKNDLEAIKEKVALSLPPQISPEKFVRVVMTAVQSQPALMNADRQSLLLSCMKCSQDGLLPDGREAALVIFRTKKKVDGQDRWIDAVQYMPMITGIITKVRRSGELLSLSANVVYQNDTFRYVLGDDERIEHEPCLSDRGAMIAAYAIAKTKDGGVYREVMSIDDINQVRNASRSKDNGPWKDWYSEMAKKTVLRRLSKRLPMSTDLEAVIQHVDDDYDFKSKRQQLGTPNLSARLSAPSDAPAEGFNSNGLVTDAEVEEFDTETPRASAVSEKPASDDTPPSLTDAGDSFPGDFPPAGETKGGGAETPQVSPSFDVIAWADKLIGDLPFFSPEQINALETDKREQARFALLSSTDAEKASELQAAIKDAKEG